MKKEDIEVLNYETFYKEGSKIIGFVDIRLPKMHGWEINHISHMQNANKRWFNYSSYKKDTANGTEYKPYGKFKEASYNEQLLELLSDPVKEYCARNGIAITPQPAALDFDDGRDLPF